jgi:hypothetical protein
MENQPPRSPEPKHRSYDFAAAVETARDHIPIEKALSAAPGDFAIVDTGEKFAVYELRDFQRGGIAGKPCRRGDINP